METNKIYWFDLDGVLWTSHAMWWVIDKLNPAKPIIRISQYDGALILSGFYRHDNIFVQYNGHEGFISKDMFLKIQKIKNIEPKNIGFSWREFSDSKLIESQAKNVTINIKYIEHLKDCTSPINLLTARGNLQAHKMLLDKLNVELSKLNLSINKECFVNDISVQNITGSSAKRKAYFILQNMIGYELEIDKFVPIKCDKFNESYFYDDEDKNIEECLNMNLLFQTMLNNTLPALRKLIIEDIKVRCPKLFVNLATTNEANLFITKEVILSI